MVHFGMPGVRSSRDSVETSLIWGGDDNKVAVLTMGTQYDSTILDASATPTTSIRAGLLVGESTATSQMTEWVSTASDGSEMLRGIVPLQFSTLDEDGTAEDQFLPMIIRAPLHATSLLIQGAAFVGHADEFIARHNLHGMGCILDDDPQGYLAGSSWRQKIHTGDKTLTSVDNYTRYLCHSADADFTLPAVQNGLKFRFFMSEEFELQISSATAVFVTVNGATGSGITYTTATEQIGVNLEVEGVNIDIAGTNTPSWIMTRFVTGLDQAATDFVARTVD